MTAGVRLGTARQHTTASQRELAELAGLSPSMVWQIESGTIAAPSGTTLAQLAEVLGVSLDWLIRGEGPDPQAEDVQAAVERARLRRSA